MKTNREILKNRIDEILFQVANEKDEYTFTYSYTTYRNWKKVQTDIYSVIDKVFDGLK